MAPHGGAAQCAETNGKAHPVMGWARLEEPWIKAAVDQAQPFEAISST